MLKSHWDLLRESFDGACGAIRRFGSHEDACIRRIHAPYVRLRSAFAEQAASRRSPGDCRRSMRTAR
ncbi:hypothetical protein D8O27_28845 [Burkholderia mallei]|uniref:Uncharacterized protein n=1 Tax=Burkholderia mallei TaxID=13373 RepID=A0AAX1XFI6_BURML|nr:hypothetical protein BOC35_10220 [Burkholderia pseudomallei]EEC37998.1 conserved hypothetical protein [Burkholderia pseudomallei 576]PNX00807.1 hypothetical protein CF649_21395 [Burkholderia sp. 136(2017)]PNX12871.1 hypothetical protein CF650_23090 [Burkholderia sp. 129]PNX27506.1 hypothetical protein CF647_21060 [Burkholderia sp. 117]PNX36157.1 hypothetical protein CF648_22305 [Burkholderia sp. 137]RKN90949.1 hypothetical protein D8O31_29130 [Burkholderia mallei]